MTLTALHLLANRLPNDRHDAAYQLSRALIELFRNLQSVQGLQALRSATTGMAAAAIHTSNASARVQNL